MPFRPSRYLLGRYIHTFIIDVYTYHRNVRIDECEGEKCVTAQRDGNTSDHPEDIPASLVHTESKHWRRHGRDDVDDTVNNKSEWK